MKKFLSITAGLLVLTGCDKDPVVVEEDLQQNRAPKDFALISPAMGAQTDVLDIVFEWEPAVDPDGDGVTYDLYVSRNNSPVRIAENLKQPSYIWKGRNNFNTAFRWYVVAKDGTIKGQTNSVKRDFTTRNLQLKHILSDGSHSSFPERSAYTGMYFNRNFYIISGYEEGSRGDVWASRDYGRTWGLKNDFSGTRFERYAHSGVIFHNRMYIIGGHRNQQPLGDIYASADATNWTRMQYTELRSRYDHSSVVFNDKIWVIGGYDNELYIDDVRSWTGLAQDSWELVASAVSTPFNGIRGHSSVVFDDKMWVIGGMERTGYVNNVWVTTNGRSWTQARDLPVMSAYHKSVVFDDKIWVIGGLTEAGPSNTMYYYEKDSGWNRYELPAGTSLRALYNHEIVVVDEGGPDDGIYIFGSFDGSDYFNDVWKLY